MNAIAIDTETTGPFLYHGCKPFMVTACDDKGKLFKWEFDVDPFTREPKYYQSLITKIYDTLLSYNTWIFHNALFDLKALSLIDESFDEQFDSIDIHDTMLMAHCHNSLDRLALKGLALLYVDYPETDEKDLHRTVTRARRIAKGFGWAIASEEEESLRPLKDKKGMCDFWLPRAVARLSPPGTLEAEDRQHFLNVCKTYALGDVERTMGLYIYFREMLDRRNDWDHYLNNARCLLPTYHMQGRGFHTRRDRLPKLLHNLSQVKEGVRQGLQRLSLTTDFNPRSKPQLDKALYETLAVECSSFTEKGNPATDKEAIKGILEQADINTRQEQFCRRLLTYRQLNTAQTYLDSYQRFEINSHLYPSLNPAGTSTTRYACRSPNAQNISKQNKDEDSLDMTVSFNLRDAFGPPKGKLWICIDYAQLQLRIFAHACEDAFLMDAFERGLDIHDTVAREVFRTEQPTSLQRRAAKAINFGIIFGAGRNKIERMSKIDGSYDLFKDRFPLVDKYLKSCERTARKTGFIRTLGGYPLRVPRKTAYKACNYVVQGTEGEMVKLALTSCDQYCWDPWIPFEPIMVIHDEIIFQTKKPMEATELENHNMEIRQLFQLMNQAGSDVHVKTEVDAKFTSTVWSECQPLMLPYLV